MACFRFWLNATRKVHVSTAAAFGILAVSDRNDKSEQLECGRLWQRMHLWAITQGLAMQPLNQMPERAAREEVLGIEPKFSNTLAEFIGDPNWQALMMFRIGYPTAEAIPSPRRAVGDLTSSASVYERGFQESLLGLPLSATRLTLRSFPTQAEIDVSRGVSSDVSHRT